jgi:hypothetical protein
VRVVDDVEHDQELPVHCVGQVRIQDGVLRLRLVAQLDLDRARTGRAFHLEHTLAGRVAVRFGIDGEALEDDGRDELRVEAVPLVGQCVEAGDR